MTKNEFAVQESRLLDSKKKSLLKKLTSRIIVWFILTFCNILCCIFNGNNKNNSCLKKKFVFIGRFESDNWIRAHIKPLATSDFCDHIWIVSDKKLLEITNVTYVLPDPLIKKVLGGIVARLYTAHKISRINKVHYVGGFHLLLNGMLAHVLAKINRAKSIYFCVG